VSDSILAQGLAQVQRDLAALPPEAKGAMFAMAEYDGTRVKAKAGIVAPFGDGWKLVGEVELSKAEAERLNVGARAAVVRTW
jgi:hypothetical protein